VAENAITLPDANQWLLLERAMAILATHQMRDQRRYHRVVSSK